MQARIGRPAGPPPAQRCRSRERVRRPGGRPEAGGFGGFLRVTFNAVAIAVLAAVLADFAVRNAALVLNLRGFPAGIPPEIGGFVDPETHRRTGEYLAVKMKYLLASSAFDTALLLCFWFAGGFGILDTLVRSLGAGSVVSGVLYIGALFAGQQIVSLPWGAYFTFVVENRFGFNKSTRATFAGDFLKGAAIYAVIGVPALAGVLAIFEYAGGWAWALCWAATSAFSLAFGFVYPVLILPLFNRLTPMPEGPLRKGILDYAARTGYAVRDVFVMDGSRRSGHTNAFVVGFGRFRKIALFDTMIAKHEIPELVGIVAHEVGHWKLGHAKRHMAVGFVRTGIMFLLLGLVLGSRELFSAFGIEALSAGAGLVLFGIVFSPVTTATGVLFNAMRRRREYEADRFAGLTTGDPEALAAGLVKMNVHNLSNFFPHRLAVLLYGTHPPTLDRVRALRALSTPPLPSLKQ